jgi:hypothetical protein
LRDLLHHFIPHHEAFMEAVGSPSSMTSSCLGPIFANSMIRNYLKGRDGDRNNAVLAAAGYNFSLLLRWLARLLRALIQALFPAPLTAQIG